MEIKIQSIHFDATEKLQAFIDKKVQKLEKLVGEDEAVDVILKVVKPATALNKEVSIQLQTLGTTVRVEKTCDTFEEAVDLCVDALKTQVNKLKDKKMHK